MSLPLEFAGSSGNLRCGSPRASRLYKTTGERSIVSQKSQLSRKYHRHEVPTIIGKVTIIVRSRRACGESFGDIIVGLKELINLVYKGSGSSDLTRGRTSLHFTANSCICIIQFERSSP